MSETMVERVALAVADKDIFGSGFDPFEHPGTFDFCERIARTALAALSQWLREQEDEIDNHIPFRCVPDWIDEALKTTPLDSNKGIGG